MSEDTAVSGVSGQYELQVSFEGPDKTIPINITPALMNYTTIISDLDNFLPSLSMSLNDEIGFLSHMLPADNTWNRVHIGTSQDVVRDWTFRIFRRFPVAKALAQMKWEIEGLLKVDGMFSPSRQRVFKDASVKEVIESIAKEMGCTSEVSSDLDFNIPNLYQPSISNAQFLRYLEERLMGKTNQVAFYCRIRPDGTKPKLSFQGLNEMIQKPAEITMIYCDTPSTDDRAAYNMQIVDNSYINHQFGTKRFCYKYFDFKEGEYVSSKLGAHSKEEMDEYPGEEIASLQLCEYMAIDKDAPEDFIEVNGLGASNGFTDDFKGLGQSWYNKRLLNLVQVWVDTDGDFDLWPGQIVKLDFPPQMITREMKAYQFSGYWMIKRVVQSVTRIHHTRLLLTRSGYDVVDDKISNLMPSPQVYGKASA